MVNKATTTAPTRRKRLQFVMPDVYVILFGITVLGAIATYIVPAGTYDRVEKNGLTIVEDGTYHQIANTPANLGDLFMAFPQGFIDSSNIFFLILFLGATFEVMQYSGAVDAGIKALVGRFNNRTGPVILIFGGIFSILTAVGFSSNALIAFIPMGLLIAKSLNLDALTAVAIVFFAGFAGFNTGPLNPKVLGVAQEIAGVPIFSGLGFRVIIWVVIVGLTLGYTAWYARRVARNPAKSFMGSVRFPEGAIAPSETTPDTEENAKFTRSHALVLLIFGAGIAYYVFGAIKLNFGINEMTAVFLAISIVVAVVSRINPNTFVHVFMAGCQKLVYGAAIVGAARAITVVLEQGAILDTIIHSFATLLIPLSPVVGAIMMFLSNGVINFFIPSGSGQAFVTMPIMTPLADLIGIPRQVAVEAFQLGDGFTNLIIPTNGVLMASLAIARVKYTTWLKFIWLPLLVFMIIGCIVVAIGVAINWGPV